MAHLKPHLNCLRSGFATTLLAFAVTPTTAQAQVELISGGGFDNSVSTFAANGWTTAMPGYYRQWQVGPLGGAASGTKCAYLGSTQVHDGSNLASVVHFYRDVTIPANAYGVSLKFKYRTPVVDNGRDYFRVYTTDATTVPVAGVEPGSGFTQRFENTANATPSFISAPALDLSSLAGSAPVTVRLVFTFVSNGLLPHANPSVDDVSMTIQGAPPCSGNRVVVAINTDQHADQTTWQIKNDAGGILANGGPYLGRNNTLVTDTVCLGAAPGCFRLQVFDNFGDGLGGTGSWKLLTTTGKLILGDQFDKGYVSPSQSPASPAYGAGHSFCLPLGSASILPDECGVFNNMLSNKVHCNAVSGATQYEFEFTDPDNGFVRRITTGTSYVKFLDLGANNLTPGVHYFCRVRSNAGGPIASANWGSGCEVGLGVNETLTCTELISSPSYGHSCNEMRKFGYYGGYIYAQPVLGATQYQFNIYTPDGVYDTLITRSSYILQLKWTGNPLVDGTTYNVAINAITVGLNTGFCPTTCTITINNALLSQTQVHQLDAGTEQNLEVWPNPNDGRDVALNIAGLEEQVDHANVELFDATGRSVRSLAVPVQNGLMNNTMNLAGVANGTYVLCVQAGDKVYNSALVVRQQ
ncbi:MAG: T9SS type A sorting domain-containing protein [Flavobacteriales bacterium]